MYLISDSQRDEVLQRLQELASICRACRCQGDTLRRCGLLSNALAKCARVDHKTARRIMAEAQKPTTSITTFKTTTK